MRSYGGARTGQRRGSTRCLRLDGCSTLVVEIDSRAFHTGPRAFERDRVKDAELQKAGYRVLRITEKRLYGDPQGVLRDIRALARLASAR